MMASVLDIIFLFMGSLFLLAILYLYFLAVVSLLPEKQSIQKFSPIVKFAIVIPAHNESIVIERTLDSVKEVDYPKELYDVYVVADNCEDNTAGIVRQKGLACWERHDTAQRGKGYVLKWAFERLLQEGDHGAYVIIDADTLMDNAFLKTMNQKIMEGAMAIQGYYDVIHPERSPMGSLSYLGFVLSRNLRYKGRTRLGWTTNLLGNGMCFTKEVIQKFGWSATSIVEDIEYEMFLLMNGIKVVFAPEARIYAEIPDTFSKSKVQRGRWDTGKFEVRNKYLPKLIREGIRKKDFSYFDAAMELLIPPFSLFVIMVFTGFLLFLILDFHGLNMNFNIWTFVIVALSVYVVGGLLIAQPPLRLYLSLIYAPYFLLWRLWVVLGGIWHRNHRVWVKTERK
jgi:cellulose synthase/poly-beta-1,6-N-acetylglucosamine synthase-like glycosyltransferase